MRSTFTLIFFCFIINSCFAQFYVDQKVSTSGNGTKKQPFKTITEAAKVAEAGDVVLINDGLYREHVLPKNKGTKKSPITFKAINPGKVIISGADIVTNWQKVDSLPGIYKREWNTYFKIGKDDYTHRYERWGRADLAVADNKLMVFFENLETLKSKLDSVVNKTAQKKYMGNDDWKAPNVHDPYSWTGAFYNDIATNTSYIWVQNGEDPNNHVIELAKRDRAFGNYFNQDSMEYIHVKDLIFRHCATFPQRPAVGLKGVGNYAEGCVIEDNAGGGILVDGSIKRCVIQRNGHIGGQANQNNIESLWRENSWKPISRDWEAGGTKVISAIGAVFNKCAFVHNGGPGLWFDIDNKNCKVSECVFYENEGPGVYYEISSDVEIYNNLSVRNAVFKVQVDKPTLAWGAGGIMIGESYNVNIHNNTCVGNKDGIGIREIATNRFGGKFAGGPNKEELPYWSHDITIKNNLLVNNSRKADEKGGLGYALGLWYATENMGPNNWESNEKPEASEWINTLKPTDKIKDPLAENIVVEGNLMAVAPKNKAVLIGVPWKRLSKEFKTIEEFEAYTKWVNTGQIIEDPKFVAIEKDNYKLKRKSLAAKSKVGWQNPPANIHAWIKSIIPAYAD